MVYLGRFDEQGYQWETLRDQRDGGFSYFDKRKGWWAQFGTFSKVNANIRRKGIS